MLILDLQKKYNPSLIYDPVQDGCYGSQVPDDQVHLHKHAVEEAAGLKPDEEAASAERKSVQVSAGGDTPCAVTSAGEIPAGAVAATPIKTPSASVASSVSTIVRITTCASEDSIAAVRSPSSTL